MGLNASEDEKFCFNMLSHVSRSFALVIDNLEEPLRTAVCVFYLILRSLDTIEDDTTVEKAVRLAALENFPSNLDQLKQYSPETIGEGLISSCDTNQYEIQLLKKFTVVLRVFDALSIDNKNIIRCSAKEMSEGMIKYLFKPIETLSDYNEYCYYVAGVVGVGLTKLFRANFVVDIDADSKNIQNLAVAMGVFLQKANIIRDTYEDIIQPQTRFFYPTEIWKKYVKNYRDLIDENHQSQALRCLNYFIDDAFQHFSDSVEYLSLMPKEVFPFCAIPQAAAIGAFVKIYNNPAVFRSKVKLEPEESMYIYGNVTDMRSFLKITKPYLAALSEKVVSSNSCDNEDMWILKSLKYVNENERKF